MSLLTSLEQKIGRFAIPNLITVIAGLQVLNWFLIKAVPEFTEKLVFIPEAVWQGEVWRLVSYIFLPGSTSIFWLLFIGFIFMLNDGLEEAWGSFKVNLFLFAGVMFVSVGGLIFDYATTGAILWSGILFAFAIYFPNQEILLYYVIPVKVKWIAWITAAGLLFGFIGGSMNRWEIACSLLNFAIAFGPGLLKDVRQRATVAERRHRYQEAQRSDAVSLHQCAKCQRTELQNPQLEFRVNAEGEDVCNECRAKK